MDEFALGGGDVLGGSGAAVRARPDGCLTQRTSADGGGWVQPDERVRARCCFVERGRHVGGEWASQCGEVVGGELIELSGVVEERGRAGDVVEKSKRPRFFFSLVLLLLLMPSLVFLQRRMIGARQPAAAVQSVVAIQTRRANCYDPAFGQL